MPSNPSTFAVSTRPEDYLVGIDVGTSAVRTLVAMRDPSGQKLAIVGKGEAPNTGCRRDSIVNVEATVEALRQASEEAEVMAGIEISRAYVGIAGRDIRSINASGFVSITGKEREIGPNDVRRVMDTTRTDALPPDFEVLHAVPQEFVVDQQRGIADPVGMLGSRLEVFAHLVTAEQKRTRMLQSCVNRAGIEVVELVFEPLATAEALLTSDERELGVLLIDLGAGSTEYALYHHGEVQHSAVLPIGGGHFTRDLAQVLRTPTDEAERMKIRAGCCLSGLYNDQAVINVPAVAGGEARTVRRQELVEILQPRAEELLCLIRDDLARRGLGDQLTGGVVLSGGAVQLNGLLEMAASVFSANVRYGMPRHFEGLVDVIKDNPSWCCAAGLLRYGLLVERSQRRGRGRRLSVRGLMSNLRSMFADLL
ncbi:MAG: cell division protein FtsA [Acidobacteriota bacterium]